MVCKDVPPDCDVLLCNSCSSPWHMQCLHPPLESVPSGDWDCPDCCLSPLSSSFSVPPLAPAAVDKPFQAPASEVVSRIRAIQADESLTEVEKAKRRQEIMSKGLNDTASLLTRAPLNGCPTKNGDGGNWNSTLKFLDQSLDCIFCMQLADRPVTVSSVAICMYRCPLFSCPLSLNPVGFQRKKRSTSVSESSSF